LERLLFSLQPCKLKAFPQKDSPFLCCTRKHFQKLKGNKFPKTLTKTWKTSLTPQTSMLEISKTWRTLFHTFELETCNLKTWRTFFHTYELTTLWRSLFHTSHPLGKVASSLYATTWKWTPTHFAN
jgi:hypothetical protein